MNEIGYVIKMEGNELTVCTEVDASAAKCDHGCSSCKGGDPKRSIRAVNPQGFALSLDDKVEIYYPPGKTIRAAFFVLIFPLLLFILAYWIVTSLLGIQSEGIAFLAGCGGLGLGFLLNFLVQKIRGKPELPYVIKKL